MGTERPGATRLFGMEVAPSPGATQLFGMGTERPGATQLFGMEVARASVSHTA
jgi:hypothetical protein